LGKERKKGRAGYKSGRYIFAAYVSWGGCKHINISIIFSEDWASSQSGYLIRVKLRSGDPNLSLQMEL
jgi:hypothetical protein